MKNETQMHPEKPLVAPILAKRACRPERGCAADGEGWTTGTARRCYLVLHAAEALTGQSVYRLVLALEQLPRLLLDSVPRLPACLRPRNLLASTDRSVHPSRRLSPRYIAVFPQQQYVQWRINVEPVKDSRKYLKIKHFKERRPLKTSPGFPGVLWETLITQPS